MNKGKRVYHLHNKRTAYRKRSFDSVTFKIIGIVVIFVLLLFVCDRAHGADVNPANTWSAVHELLHRDYSAANEERNTLIEELDVVLALVNYTEGRIDNFDSENGLDNLDARVNALLELITETDRVLESVLRDITWFVKNHTGI